MSQPAAAPSASTPPASRSVVVTGAAKGIGLATVERLLAGGDPVVGVDIDEAELCARADALGFVPLVGDIGEWETHERAADAAEALAPLAGWVNNAAIDTQGAAHELDAETIDRALRVLQLGPMYGTCVAVRRMLPRRQGAIVTISSIQAIATWPRYFVYGSAKAALLQMTRSVAVDYGAFGIRANAILPGTVETPMTYSVLDPALPREVAIAAEAALSPLGRVAQPHEIASAVAWLLSDDASYVSGAALPVDGASTSRVFPYPPLEL